MLIRAWPRARRHQARSARARRASATCRGSTGRCCIGISGDGRTLLLDETAEAVARAAWSTCAAWTAPRPSASATARAALSPDGESGSSACATARGGLGAPIVLPTGVGEPRDVATGGLYRAIMAALARRQPHDDRDGARARQGRALYQLDSTTGESHPLSPEASTRPSSPSCLRSKAVAAMSADHDHWLYPLDGGDPTPIRRSKAQRPRGHVAAGRERGAVLPHERDARAHPPACLATMRQAPWRAG